MIPIPTHIKITLEEHPLIEGGNVLFYGEIVISCFKDYDGINYELKQVFVEADRLLKAPIELAANDPIYAALARSLKSPRAKQYIEFEIDRHFPLQHRRAS